MFLFGRYSVLGGFACCYAFANVLNVWQDVLGGFCPLLYGY